MASSGRVNPVGDAIGALQVSAILLDAGGVLVFPEPDRLLPLLRAAGVDPDLATLERAHYRAMAIQDAEALPPVRESWWRNYLLGYVAACGVGQDRAELLATEMAQRIRGHAWVHVGLGAMDGLQAVAALGLPMGVVSNSDGSVEGDLRRLGVCHVPAVTDGPDPSAGVAMGVILDSAVVGVAKPDPAIFRIALDALGVPGGPFGPARRRQPALRRGRRPRGRTPARPHGPARVLPGARRPPAHPQPGRTRRPSMLARGDDPPRPPGGA